MGRIRNLVDAGSRSASCETWHVVILSSGPTQVLILWMSSDQSFLGRQQQPTQRYSAVIGDCMHRRVRVLILRGSVPFPILPFSSPSFPVLLSSSSPKFLFPPYYSPVSFPFQSIEPGNATSSYTEFVSDPLSWKRYRQLYPLHST